MLVAAAACPCPPLLVPEVAVAPPRSWTRRAPPARTRSACSPPPAPTCWWSWGRTPERVTTRRAPRARSVASASTWTYGWGRWRRPRRRWRWRGDGRELPYGLAVGAWLLGRTGWPARPSRGGAWWSPSRPTRVSRRGRRLVWPGRPGGTAGDGDGSACRTLKAPGYLDERAAPFDAEIARALGTADTAALRALDAGLARELKVSGRAPWQVLAGAAEGAAGLSGALLHEDAPYGVGYMVATWS